MIRVHLDQFEAEGKNLNQVLENSRRIKVMQWDISKHMDSTSIEKYLRSFIDLENMNMPIIINTSGYGGYWQVMEDKLFHELQFDQLTYYQS